MKVILSIKPEFATKIFNGSKKYEFRRSLFKNPSVNKVVVYASAPISKVIGEFEIDHVIHSDIDELWQTTEEHAGISKEYYMSYFDGKEAGYAIKIKKTKKYPDQLSIEQEYGIKPPQSFAYLHKEPGQLDLKLNR
ncbi:MAG: ASCH domain-containing protein [Calditrichia bacterium]